MILDLLNLTEEDIQNSTNRVVGETDTFIMYLQNNGIKDFRWDLNDISPWISEDIEE